ncbi:MAG: hypothetical protein ACLSFO_03390 [Anaerovoracaceae bacterium]
MIIQKLFLCEKKRINKTKERMSHKAVSILLVISIFTVSGLAAFASENIPAESEKVVCSTTLSHTLAFSIINGSEENGDNGSNSGITLFGNERYKYKTVINYGSGKAETTIQKLKPRLQLLIKCCIKRCSLR